MALIKCGGADVLRGRIHMPTRGAWWSDLVLDTATAPTGSVQIQADGGLDIKGTVIKGGTYFDSAHVRIVGGAGGLGKEIEPQAYQNAQLRDPLGLVTAASGDTLSSTIDQALLSTLLDAWVATKTNAGQALEELCAKASASTGKSIGWRYLADGTLWLGAESWPTAKLPVNDTLLDPDPSSGAQEIGVATPSLLPGVNLDGVGQVTAVDHWLDSDKTRTTAWAATTALTDLIASVVRSIVGLSKMPGGAPVIDRLAMYRAEVKVASNDGKTLDIQPDTDRLSGMQRVPLRVGIPGAVGVVQPGAVVMVGWEGGDPSKPYCVPAWEPGASVAKLVLPADVVHLGAESGSQPVALADKVDARILALVAYINGHTHPETGTTTQAPTVACGSQQTVAAINTRAK